MWPAERKVRKLQATVEACKYRSAGGEAQPQPDTVDGIVDEIQTILETYQVNRDAMSHLYPPPNAAEPPHAVDPNVQCCAYVVAESGPTEPRRCRASIRHHKRYCSMHAEAYHRSYESQLNKEALAAQVMREISDPLQVTLASRYLNSLYACLEARVSVMHAFFRPGTPCEEKRKAHERAMRWYDGPLLHRAMQIVLEAQQAERDEALAREMMMVEEKSSQAPSQSKQPKQPKKNKPVAGEKGSGKAPRKQTALPSDDIIDFWGLVADEQERKRMLRAFEEATEWVLRPDLVAAQTCIPCPPPLDMMDVKSVTSHAEHKMLGEQWHHLFQPMMDRIDRMLNSEGEARWILCSSTQTGETLHATSPPLSVYTDTHSTILLRKGGLIAICFGSPEARTEERAYNMKKFYLKSYVHFPVQCEMQEKLNQNFGPHFPFGGYRRMGNFFFFPNTSDGISAARRCWRGSLETMEAADLRLKHFLRDIIRGTDVSAAWNDRKQTVFPKGSGLEIHPLEMSGFSLVNTKSLHTQKYFFPFLEVTVGNRIDALRTTSSRVSYQTHRFSPSMENQKARNAHIAAGVKDRKEHQEE